MRTSSLISSAVQNSFRAKTRTLLTVLAVFIGAFTLTVTNGLGTGTMLSNPRGIAVFDTEDFGPWPSLF